MTAPSPLAPTSQIQAPRILIVEPNRSALGVLARRLGEAGYRIVAADSAQAAVAELYRLPVDLVLAELAMPVMSGIDLARLIRDDTALRDLAIILIAGRSNRGGAVEALDAGADDIVVKPFDHDLLLARIARQLSRARATKQLRADNAVLDARVVTRAIELGEMRVALAASEGERARLAGLVAN